MSGLVHNAAWLKSDWVDSRIPSATAPDPEVRTMSSTLRVPGRNAKMISSVSLLTRQYQNEMANSDGLKCDIDPSL